MKTRFAPSPTGLMHFGNLRTALFNYLYAKQQQGQLVLRIEDTDLNRSTIEYYNNLLTDLNWAGINWQEGPYKQSERTAIYEQYFQQLKQDNLVYPCFCSEAELANNKKMQLAKGLPPRYPGTCKNLTPTAIQEKLASGIKPTLRFKVPSNQIIEFTDLIKGKQTFKTNDIGDFIIQRQDGSASFMLCNAIDDALMAITHALRGDDHLANTPKQILILQALGLTIPQYGHFPMINGINGAPLSKRNGSEAIQTLREQGYQPLAILNYLARLGHYYENNNFMTIEELVNNFQLKNINTSPAKHDNTHLRHWQKESLLRLTSQQFWHLIEPLVKSLVPQQHALTFAELILPNTLMPSEAISWATAIFAKELPALTAEENIILKQAGLQFFTCAKEARQQQPELSLKELLTIITTVTKKKGKNLFLPLRLALTGKNHGPELDKLVTLMPKTIIIARFEQAISLCQESN